MPKEFTVVLPVHNEEKILESSLKTLLSYLRDKYSQYHVLICDDGSEDATPAISKMIAGKEENIDYRRYSNGPSRRENLARALLSVNTPVAGFIDSDISIAREDLLAIINAVRQEKYDIVVGSRYKKTYTNRPLTRLLISKLYNRFHQIILDSRIADHNCGIKFFDFSKSRKILEKAGYDQNFTRGWFWDAEILVRAQREGLNIKEVPVSWQNNTTSFKLERELRMVPYILRFAFQDRR